MKLEAGKPAGSGRVSACFGTSWAAAAGLNLILDPMTGGRPRGNEAMRKHSGAIPCRSPAAGRCLVEREAHIHIHRTGHILEISNDTHDGHVALLVVRYPFDLHASLPSQAPAG